MEECPIKTKYVVRYQKCVGQDPCGRSEYESYSQQFTDRADAEICWKNLAMQGGFTAIQLVEITETITYDLGNWSNL